MSSLLHSFHGLAITGSVFVARVGSEIAGSFLDGMSVGMFRFTKYTACFMSATQL